MCTLDIDTISKRLSATRGLSLVHLRARASEGIFAISHAVRIPGRKVNGKHRRPIEPYSRARRSAFVFVGASCSDTPIAVRVPSVDQSTAGTSVLVHTSTRSNASNVANFVVKKTPKAKNKGWRIQHSLDAALSEKYNSVKSITYRKIRFYYFKHKGYFSPGTKYTITLI